MTSVRIRPGFRRLAPLTRYISTHAVLAVTASVGGLVILGLTAASAAVYDAVAEKDGISSLDRPALDQVIAWRTPLANRIFTGFTHLGGPLLMTLIASAVTLLMGGSYLLAGRQLGDSSSHLRRLRRRQHRDLEDLVELNRVLSATVKYGDGELPTYTLGPASRPGC